MTREDAGIFGHEMHARGLPASDLKAPGYEGVRHTFACAKATGTPPWSGSDRFQLLCSPCRFYALYSRPLVLVPLLQRHS